MILVNLNILNTITENLLLIFIIVFNKPLVSLRETYFQDSLCCSEKGLVLTEIWITVLLAITPKFRFPKFNDN